MTGAAENEKSKRPTAAGPRLIYTPTRAVALRARGIRNAGRLSVSQPDSTHDSEVVVHFFSPGQKRRRNNEIFELSSHRRGDVGRTPLTFGPDTRAGFWHVDVCVGTMCYSISKKVTKDVTVLHLKRLNVEVHGN